jgi:hypothetical protein
MNPEKVSAIKSVYDVNIAERIHVEVNLAELKYIGESYTHSY